MEQLRFSTENKLWSTERHLKVVSYILLHQWTIDNCKQNTPECKQFHWLGCGIVNRLTEV